MFKVNNKDTWKMSLRLFWCLHYYIWTFPSFPIVDFEQVNICQENYVILFILCLLKEGRLNKKQQSEFHYFSYFTPVRCNLSKPSITQIIHSRNTGKFVQKQPPNFGDTKIKQEIAMNPLPRIISILKNHKLHRTKDLYKAFYKISMISIQYNRIKSYYAKHVMRVKAIFRSVKNFAQADFLELKILRGKI